MLAGSAVVSLIRSPGPTWAALLILLAAHLALNHRAVRAVRLRTLNRQRAGIIFDSWIAESRVPNPTQVALRERIFERDGVVRDTSGTILGYCSIGVGFEEYMKTVSNAGSQARSYTIESRVLDVASESTGYLLHVDEQSRQCWITLAEDCTVKQQVKSWFTACFALRALHAAGNMSRQPAGVDGHAKLDPRRSSQPPTGIEALDEAQQCVESTFEEVWEGLRSMGWDVNTAALETRRGTRFAISPPAGE
ncbi:hypothetical protein ANO11243_008900 [Dothideomycetidae sp. 11243]|nr:hypothetical protein ANO11243_008900 [fungal sp. No.11243]